jgi:phosphatidylglycerol:prolipoprotein diacylglycerol transferase
MRPVLFDALGIRLFSYTVLLDAGLVTGLLVAAVCARRRGLDRARALDAGLWAILGALIGARAHYVLSNWSYFHEQPAEIVRFWHGGYSLTGGILTGALAVWAYARVTRTATPALLDVLAPSVAVGQVFGWLGCFLAGCAYGRTARGLGTLLLPDIYGRMDHRYATQLLAAGVSLLVLAATVATLLRARRRGWAFTVWLAGTFAGQLALEFTRGDDTLLVGGLRLGVWIGALGLLAALMLAGVLARRRASVEPAATGPSVPAGETDASHKDEGLPHPETVHDNQGREAEGRP